VDQLLIALDVESASDALALADSLRGIAGGFKIGNRLFTSEGPSIVRALTEQGDRVFLDLKFHDIPNTVAQAVAAATSLGVWMLNVHASGGTTMMRAARDAARETADRTGTTPPLVIAVTVLTSMNGAALAEIGCASEEPTGSPESGIRPPTSSGRLEVVEGDSGPVIDQVIRLAQLAEAAGLDGVVASARETAMIRKRCRRDFAIVTPGIRGDGAVTTGRDDQERTMSAGEAIAAGASYLVVGRPIIAAADPRAAAEAIVAEAERRRNC
jgi:orotidine-5'-phosphate decarboxylase